MKLSTKVLAGAALLSLSAASMALPVSGGVSFSSLPDLEFSFDMDTNTFDFAEQDNGQVTQTTGDFSSYFTVGDLVRFFDFDYNEPFSAQDIWFGNGITFTLNSLSSVIETASTVVLEGFGVLSDGSETTGGFWTMTANTAGGTFSWSSSAAVVTEPASLALLGLGLVALGMTRQGRHHG